MHVGVLSQTQASAVALLLGLALFLRTWNAHHRISSATFTDPSGTGIFAPVDRLSLSDFLARYLARSALPPPTTQVDAPNKLDAIWTRPDTEAEQVLGVSRAAIDSPAIERLVAFPRLGAVFCPVPGVASRTLLEALVRAEGGDGGVILSQYAPRDRERFLARADIQRIVFVRHPFARALAAWYRGLAQVTESNALESEGYRAFMSAVRGHELKSSDHELVPVSLELYLVFLGAQNAAQLAEQFRPITHLCALGVVDYSFVGRLELLNSHIADLEMKIGAMLRPFHDPPPERVTNASRTMRVAFRSRSQRFKAIRLYKSDLELLRYNDQV